MSRHTFIAEVVHIRESLALECVTNAEVTLEGIWNKHITAEEEMMIDLVKDAVAQGCLCPKENSPDKYWLDSMCLSSYAEALRFLARRGIVKLIHDKGRRVIGEWAT